VSELPHEVLEVAGCPFCGVYVSNRGAMLPEGMLGGCRLMPLLPVMSQHFNECERAPPLVRFAESFVLSIGDHIAEVRESQPVVANQLAILLQPTREILTDEAALPMRDNSDAGWIPRVFRLQLNDENDWALEELDPTNSYDPTKLIQPPFNTHSVFADLPDDAGHHELLLWMRGVNQHE